ncbi:MAG TPA: VOC family protein [Acidimicrobiia bacterium]|nr:VOC family protein [Acidimicrobiia bacterium]
MPSHPQPVPEGLHTVTPRLVVSDAGAAIEFYEAAFGAEETDARFADPSGRVVHAEITIGDSVVRLTEDSRDGNGIAPDRNDGQVTTILAITVPDVDALWARATAAGAEVVFPLADQFYGDRGGRLRDPFGHQWMLSTHIEDVSPEELERRARQLGTG